jgi:hypothetical protein
MPTAGVKFSSIRLLMISLRTWLGATQIYLPKADKGKILIIAYNFVIYK